MPLSWKEESVHSLNIELWIVSIHAGKISQVTRLKYNIEISETLCTYQML